MTIKKNIAAAVLLIFCHIPVLAYAIDINASFINPAAPQNMAHHGEKSLKNQEFLASSTPFVTLHGEQPGIQEFRQTITTWTESKKTFHHGEKSLKNQGLSAISIPRVTLHGEQPGIQENWEAITTSESVLDALKNLNTPSSPPAITIMDQFRRLQQQQLLLEQLKAQAATKITK